MTDDRRPDVDFVIGEPGDEADELLDTGEPGHIDRRWIVALVVAALVVIGVVVAVRGHSPRPSASPSSSTTSSSTTPGPVIPSFVTGSVDPGYTVQTTVQLTRNLCVAGRTCFRIATTNSARAKIAAAIEQSFGRVRNLRIRDSAIALDDPPRKSLFARDITALTPIGRVHVVAAAVGPDSVLALTVDPGTIGTNAVGPTYALAGSVTARPNRGVGQPGGRLSDLVNDPRLTVRS